MANEYADVLGIIARGVGGVSQSTMDIESNIALNNKYLVNIDKNIQNLLKVGLDISQDNARAGSVSNRIRRSSEETRSQKDANIDRNNDDRVTNKNKPKTPKYESFLEEFEKSLLDGFGINFNNALSNIANNFAGMLGVNLEEVPGAIGAELGKMATDAIKGSALGKNLQDKVDNLKNSALDKVGGWYDSKVQNYVDNKGGMAEGQKMPTFKDLVSPITNVSNADGGSVGSAGVIGGVADSIVGAVGNIIPDASSISMEDANLSPLENINVNVAQILSILQSGETGAEDLASEIEGQMDMFENLQNIGENFDQIKDIKKIADTAQNAKAAGALGKAGTASVQGVGVAGGAGAAGGAGTAGAAAGASSAGAALAPLAAAAPYILLIVGAVIVISTLMKPLIAAAKDVSKNFKEFKENLRAAANRDADQRNKFQKLANERMEADLKHMIEYPFDILKAAVEDVVQSWEKNIRTINQTQGTNKAELQDLMARYAQRLTDAGMERVIGHNEIIDGLSKVLGSGLSGAVAEEFAYLATVLGNAVPTEDFFSYADTYASLAANAIRLGASEAEAIEYANAQMEQFASNVLYASRQIAGGFSTGLKNANDLFAKSAQIAQASRTGDAAQISSVLTSVAAITGAIAPDLSSAMMDAVLKAATGGNSSEIVALRSLAGINASNTQFLQQLANDPQAVFSAVFKGLSEMQNMSETGWMEVAEGLSGTFGISMDALARVDFAYLAQAIDNMQVSNASLAENIEMLASGESTTTADQLRMAEINKEIQDQGLSYVLDNAAARSIQENMWAEQRKREIIEAEYGVNIKGSALDLLNSLVNLGQKILDFLNPIRWIARSVSNMITSSQEVAAQEADVRAMLEAGKVGSGNAQSLYQLTTRNADLNIVPGGILGMMGQSSQYQAKSAQRQSNANIINGVGAFLGGGLYGLGLNALTANYGNRSSGPSSMLGSGSTATNSAYAWNNLGKSTAADYSANYGGSAAGSNAFATLLSQSGLDSLSNTMAAQNEANENIMRMINEMESKIKEDNSLSYEKWKRSSKSYGVGNFDDAVKAAGIDAGALKEMFYDLQTDEGMEETYNRYVMEEEVWKKIALEEGSIWHLTGEANISRDEFKQEFTEYHANFQMQLDNVNKTLDWIFIALLTLHTGLDASHILTNLLLTMGLESLSEYRDEFDILTNYANETRDYMMEQDFLHYENYDVKTTYTNETLTQMMLDAQEHYQKYLEMTQITHDKLDELWTLIKEETNEIYLQGIWDEVTDFKERWTHFFVEQQGQANDLNRLYYQIGRQYQTTESEKIYDLMDALLQLEDGKTNPALQTNILLAEMLKVLSQIMLQNNNKIDGLSLFDTLSGMSLGLTNAGT